MSSIQHPELFLVFELLRSSSIRFLAGRSETSVNEFSGVFKQNLLQHVLRVANSVPLGNARESTDLSSTETNVSESHFELL